MSEARILSAFWNRGQKRFCELLDAEITARSGLPISSPDFLSLRMRGFIIADRTESRLPGKAIYRLAPSGKARVSEMVASGVLPKNRTATIKEKAE